MTVITRTRGQGGGSNVRRTQQGAERAASSRAFFTSSHFRTWARGLILDTGEPWILEKWQESFVTDVFSGVPEAWLVVPEGNGKTTLVAGVALYFLEHQDFASIPIAASSRDQAEILYRQAVGFVMRTESLHALHRDALREKRGKREMEVPRFRCMDGMRRIDHYKGGRIQVFAADDRTGDGIIPTLALVDELHRHRDLRLYRTWRGKLEKRGGQLITISTAGEPGAEFEAARESIRQSGKVERDGCLTRVKTAAIVLHEWAVPEDGDVEDLKLVKKANPFSGITVPQLKRKRSSPTMTLEYWRRFVCNLPTRGGRAAVTEAEWNASATKQRIPAGQPIWVGLDVAWKWDTTAVVPYWQRDKKFRLLGAPAVLVPPRDGNSLDPNEIERALLKMHERNPIHTVVMDPTRAEQLAEWIRQKLGAKVIERSQTNAFAEVDYARFMEALRSGWLKHTGDRTLMQHVLNAVARVTPFGAARFDRIASMRDAAGQERRVIDALSAAAMVHAAANEEEPSNDKPKWRLLA